MKYRFSRFTLDPAARLLRNEDGGVELPRRAFDCLAHLIEHRERAISRDELALRIWGRQDVSDNQIAQSIAVIRRTLGDNDHRLLRTVPAFGYHWTGLVEIDGSPDPASDEPPAQIAHHLPRIQPGASFAASVETSTDPTPTPDRGMQITRRAMWPAAVLVVAAVAIAIGLVDRLIPRPVSPDPQPAIGIEIPNDPVWILPADMPEQTEHAWARIGLMALIAERLRHHGIAVVPIENVLTRFPAAAGVEHAAQSVFDETGAGLVVQTRLEHDGGGWRLALSAQRHDGERIVVYGSDGDLFAAAEPAADALALRLGGQAEDAVSASEQSFELIRQAVRAGDFDGARTQLARLPPLQRDSIDAGLIEVLIDTEQSRLEPARERIELLLERARNDNDDGALTQVLLTRISLARKARQPLWHADVDQAVALAERGQMTTHIARAVTLRGIRELEAGRYDAAIRDFSHARQAWLDAGDPLGAADAIANLGRVSPLLGNAAEALDRLSRSARVYRRYGAVVSEFVAVQSMTTIQIAMLRWDEALASSDRARMLLPHIDDPIKRASFKRRRATVLTGLGRLREAAAQMNEFEYELRRTDIGDEMRIMESVYRVPILLQSGNPEAALAVADAAFAAHYAWREARSHESAQAIQAPDYALWNWMQARAAVRALRPELVITPTDAHLTAIERAASPFALIARAEWLLEHDDIEGAEAAYRQALATAEQSNSLSRIRVATEALVLFLLSRHQLDEAQRLFDALYGRDPEALDRDYPTAQLRLSLRRAHGDLAGWQIALFRAGQLAGEREIPPSLQQAPMLLALEGVGGTAEAAHASAGPEARSNGRNPGTRHH